MIEPMSPPLLDRLQTIIKRWDFKKKEPISKIGEVSNSIFYIRSGLVRGYGLVGRREATNWIMKEGDICISVVSFLRRIPSEIALVALEPCECYGIENVELEDTYTLHPEFNKHGRIITSEYYCRSEERVQARLRQTPEDKYELLLKKDPDLIARVPAKYMASFLDISIRTYEEIRKNYPAISKNKNRANSGGHKR